MVGKYRLDWQDCLVGSQEESRLGPGGVRVTMGKRVFLEGVG